MAKKINIAIIGSTGFTGLDLVFLLSKHPKAKILNLCATKSVGKDISYFEKVANLIDQLFYEGTINEGTLQVLSDMFCSLEEPQNKEEFISQLQEIYEIDSSLESLNNYLDREFTAWQEEHEDSEEILQERFNIGESNKYPNVKEFLMTVLHEIGHALDAKRIGVRKYIKIIR